MSERISIEEAIAALKTATPEEIQPFATELVALAERVRPQIKQWANAPEIEARVMEDGYELFEDDGKGGFSEDMQRAADANEGGLFVASESRREWRDTVLKKGRYAYFYPYLGYVDVRDIHPVLRNGYRGAVRLLRV